MLIHILHKDDSLNEYESNIIDAEQVQNLKCKYEFNNPKNSNFEKNNKIEFYLSNGEIVSVKAENTIFRIYDQGEEVIVTDSQRKFEKAYILTRSGTGLPVE